MFGTEYDYDSVMHYPKNYWAKKPGLDTLQAKVSEIIELFLKN